ncbi:MAG: hypothetical protein QXP74_04410 [Nitrososphaerota archaeon]
MVGVQHFKIPFIIGAGSGAGNILTEINIEGVRKIAVNSSWRDLDMLPEDIYKVRAGEGYGSGTEPSKGEKDYKMNGSKNLRETVEKVLQESRIDDRDEVDLIPVIITAGFGFGSGSGPHIVSDLKKWFPKAVVLAWVTKPFDFEGEKVYWNSWKCIKNVMDKTGTIIVDNEYVARLVGKDKPLNMVLNMANKYITRCINTFLKIATAKSYLSRIDRTDLNKYIGKGYVAFYTNTIREFDELPRIYDSDSMLFPYLNYDHGGKMKIAVMIQSSKTPPATFTEDIVKMAEEKFSKAKLQEAKTMVSIGGENIKVSVLIGGIAAEYRKPM